MQKYILNIKEKSRFSISASMTLMLFNGALISSPSATDSTDKLNEGQGQITPPPFQALPTAEEQDGSNLFQTLFKQHKNFWKPVLDENAAFSALLSGQINMTPISQEDVFNLLYRAAEEGNAALQEKLFKFQRLPALKSLKERNGDIAQKLDNLMALGIAQRKAWAFRERAKEAEKADIEQAKKDYMTAANLDDEMALKRLKELFPCPLFPLQSRALLIEKSKKKRKLLSAKHNKEDITITS